MQPEAVCNDICSRMHPMPVKRGASGLSPESVLRTYFRTGEVCSSVPADFPADNTDSTDRAHRKSPCGLRNAICRFRRQRFVGRFPGKSPAAQGCYVIRIVSLCCKVIGFVIFIRKTEVDSDTQPVEHFVSILLLRVSRLIPDAGSTPS